MDLAFSVSRESFDEFWVGAQRVSLKMASGGAFKNIDRIGYNFFAAAGITDDLDAIVALPYVSTSTDATAAGAPADMDELQDLTLALSWRPWQQVVSNGTLSVVTALGFKTPAGNYEDDTIVAVGHRSNDLDGRLLLQYALASGLFLNVQTGYILKNGDDANGNEVPNAFPFSAKVGYSRGRWYADSWFDLQKSEGMVDIGEPKFTFRTTSIDYTRIGGIAMYQIVGDASIAFGVGHTLDGENIAKSTYFSGGIVYRLARH